MERTTASEDARDSDQAVDQTIEELRAELRKHLPDYMLPSSFTLLDKMPLNAADKIDRKALEVEVSTALVLDVISPATKIENDLRSLWAKLLLMESENICVTKDFFSLGGHSLLVVKLKAQISEHFNVVISIKNIFERNTIQALAQDIDLLQSQALAARFLSQSTEQQENMIELEF
jgi:acyl carrier protein